MYIILCIYETKFIILYESCQVVFLFHLLFSVDHVRLGPAGQRSSRAGKQKVFVSNGRDVPLHGVALIFLRTQPTVAVTDTNMTKVCDHK